MESQEESKYQVIITDPAEISFYEILEFLFDHYTLDRAEELANTLRDTISSLNYQPKRGDFEHRLIGRINEYRFILFKRIPRAEIKILYYIDESKKVVNVTDYFPTEMDDNKISIRNK